VDTVDHPGDRVAQGFLQYRSAGLPDGRQTFECPLTRTALPQLAHEDTVRQEDQVHMAGLAKAVPELTIAHAQMLLAVPMKALRPAPTAPVDPENTRYVPEGSIGHQNLAGLGVILPGPQDHDPHRMIHVRDFDAPGEIPLPVLPDRHELAILGTDALGQFFGLDRLSLEEDLAVEFQVPHIGPAVAVDMIEVGRMGKITVEGEVAGEVLRDHPIHKFPEQDVVVPEGDLFFRAGLFLDEPAELQRVVLAGGADVVDDQVVVGDLVPLLGVIPEPAGVLDELAVVVDQGIVQGNNPLGAVAGGGVLLPLGQPGLVEPPGVPEALGRDPAIEARLIGGDGKLAVDARNVLPVGHQQPGQVFGKMLAFGFVLKELPELGQGLFDDGRIIDDCRHGRILHQDFGHPVGSIYRQIAHFDFTISILQKSS